MAKNRINIDNSPYTLLARDEVLFCDTVDGAITVNLPAGIDGTHYKVINCGEYDVTVDPNGTENFFGAGAGVASVISTGENVDVHYDDVEGWY